MSVQIANDTGFFRNYKSLGWVLNLAALALALGGCNEIAAQHVAPIRPVLVTSAHYQALVPDRSFVGIIRPRIESDLGFRVAGKVSKRLVEVGAVVATGQPLATLDENDLKLQAEQAEAEFSAAGGVLAQASAAETRAKELRQKGWSTDAQLDQAKAAGDEARARLNRAERSVELTKNSLSYATLLADAPGVVTATLVEPGQVVTAGQTAIRVARVAEKRSLSQSPRRSWRTPDRAKPGSRSGRNRTSSMSRSFANLLPWPIPQRAPISPSFRCPILTTRYNLA